MNANNSFFAELFSKHGTLEVAKSMWNGYQKIRRYVEKDRYARYEPVLEAAKQGQNFVKDAYDGAISLHNGANSITGNRMNELVTYGLGHLFSQWEIAVEQKVRVGPKRDIDQMLKLPKGDVYVSTTTIPAERKDSTWKQEYKNVRQYREVNGIHEPYHFIALFAEQKRNCSLEASVNTREKKQQLMGEPIEVVCLHDVDHTAAALSRLLHKFI